MGSFYHTANLTRLLVMLFVVVFARWVEVRAAWPDAVVLPLTALVGLGLFDRLALPASLRFAPRDWVVNAGAAVALGVVIFLATGR